MTKGNAEQVLVQAGAEPVDEGDRPDPGIGWAAGAMFAQAAFHHGYLSIASAFFMRYGSIGVSRVCRRHTERKFNMS